MMSSNVQCSTALVGGCLRHLAFAALMLMLPLTFAHSESVPLKQTSEVKGQVVMLTSEFIILAPQEKKNQEGKNIFIPIAAGATIDNTVKTGDQVEVRVNADDRATAVHKLRGTSSEKK
jgi:hypothetical protein